MNWFESYAFCIWDGGFLASEAEWNYAAAGGSEQRYYPWSSPATSTTIDGTYAVFFTSSTADVGSKGAADFHRQLIKNNLASEYDHDIRSWLERLAAA